MILHWNFFTTYSYWLWVRYIFLEFTLGSPQNGFGFKSSECIIIMPTIVGGLKGPPCPHSCSGVIETTVVFVHQNGSVKQNLQISCFEVLLTPMYYLLVKLINLATSGCLL